MTRASGDQGLRPEMTNHPNRSNLSYPVAAPVFEGDGYSAEIIGRATTAVGAMRIYRRYYAGTGTKPVRALKAAPERRGQGPVDGWVPELADEPGFVEKHLTMAREG